MPSPPPKQKRRNRGRPATDKSPGRRAAQGATQARMIALRIIERVDRAGAYADLSLRYALSQSNLSSVDKGLATELVYGTLRWRGRLDYLLAKVVDRPLEGLDAMVASTLRMGAYQLIFADRIPDNAAVDQAVRCARAMGAERATGLVNAALRRLAREHRQIELPTLEDAPLEHLIHSLSLPEWIARRWLEAHGPEEAAALARVCNQPPPLTVRVNPRVATPDELMPQLLERFPDAHRCKYAALGIQLGRKGDPGRDPGFLAGRFTVQDEASQLVVSLLDPRIGEAILDTCAAPGTKTTGIAELVGDEGSVLALDRNERRLQLIARAARRLGLKSIRVLERDSTQALDGLATRANGDTIEEGGPRFDRVLVDAPCSGLGTLRRNSDARWRVKPEDPAQLAVLQRNLLERGSEVLRRGGSLVYSTCTLLPEENEQVVSRFLEQHPNFRIVGRSELPDEIAPLIDDDGFMRCHPHRHGTDGFFAARLERTE